MTKMPYQNVAIINIAIIILSLFGLFIALYIRSHKTKGNTLVCPIGHTCDPVIHSEYSRFLGIPVEILGMIYYLAVSVVYIGSTTAFVPIPVLVENIVAIMSVLAFLFSIYLTLIQAFILKQWCTWCLFSASICGTIFLLVIL